MEGKVNLERLVHAGRPFSCWLSTFVAIKLPWERDLRQYSFLRSFCFLSDKGSLSPIEKLFLHTSYPWQPEGVEALGNRTSVIQFHRSLWLLPNLQVTPPRPLMTIAPVLPLLSWLLSVTSVSTWRCHTPCSGIQFFLSLLASAILSCVALQPHSWQILDHPLLLSSHLLSHCHSRKSFQSIGPATFSLFRTHVGLNPT
jgi:hypothetical protein